MPSNERPLEEENTFGLGFLNFETFLCEKEPILLQHITDRNFVISCRTFHCIVQKWLFWKPKKWSSLFKRSQLSGEEWNLKTPSVPLFDEITSDSLHLVEPKVCESVITHLQTENYHWRKSDWLGSWHRVKNLFTVSLEQSVIPVWQKIGFLIGAVIRKFLFDFESVKLDRFECKSGFSLLFF
jgi:hypothetical protein